MLSLPTTAILSLAVTSPKNADATVTTVMTVMAILTNTTVAAHDLSAPPRTTEAQASTNPFRDSSYISDVAVFNHANTLVALNIVFGKKKLR